MAAGDREQIAVAVEFKRLDRGGERPHDYLVGIGKALAVGERRAVVDHRDVKPQHRAELRERLRDMTGADDYQPLRTCDRIEKNSRRAARLDPRGRPHRAIRADLE